MDWKKKLYLWILLLKFLANLLIYQFIYIMPKWDQEFKLDSIRIQKEIT